MDSNFRKHSSAGSYITCNCQQCLQSYQFSETGVSDAPIASTSGTFTSNFGARLAINESNFGMDPIPISTMRSDETFTQSQHLPHDYVHRSFQEALSMPLDRAGIVGNEIGSINGSSRWVAESSVAVEYGGSEPSRYTSQPIDQPLTNNASRPSILQAASYDCAAMSQPEPENQAREAADVEEYPPVIKTEVETPLQSDDDECDDMFFSFDHSKPFPFGNENSTKSTSECPNPPTTNIDQLKITQINDHSEVANQSEQGLMLPHIQNQGRFVWDYNINQVNFPTYVPALDQPMSLTTFGHGQTSAVVSNYFQQFLPMVHQSSPWTSAFDAQTPYRSHTTPPPISSYNYERMETPENDSSESQNWEANIGLSSQNSTSEYPFPPLQRRNYNQQQDYNNAYQSGLNSYQGDTSASNNQLDVADLRVPNSDQAEQNNAATVETFRNSPHPVPPTEMQRRLLVNRGASLDNSLSPRNNEVMRDIPLNHCSSCTCTSACLRNYPSEASYMSPGYSGGCYTTTNALLRLNDEGTSNEEVKEIIQVAKQGRLTMSE